MIATWRTCQDIGRDEIIDAMFASLCGLFFFCLQEKLLSLSLPCTGAATVINQRAGGGGGGGKEVSLHGCEQDLTGGVLVVGETGGLCRVAPIPGPATPLALQ